jgi:hypothetical protein
VLYIALGRHRRPGHSVLRVVPSKIAAGQAAKLDNKVMPRYNALLLVIFPPLLYLSLAPHD